jgi:hypothetical protein
LNGPTAGWVSGCKEQYYPVGVLASKWGGRNRVTTDAGLLISKADQPILGTAIPWETPSR